MKTSCACAPGLAGLAAWALAVLPVAAAPPSGGEAPRPSFGEPSVDARGSGGQSDRAALDRTSTRTSNAGVLVLAHLGGDDDARARVAERLAGALSPAPSVSASKGFVIGVADDVDAAIAWSLERLIPERAGMLDDAFALDLRSAPFAGLLTRDVAGDEDVLLLAVEIATVGVDGLVKALDTPHLLTAAPDGGATPNADAASRLALDVGSVGPLRAPLFAAPAAAIPPIDEAHAITRAGDEVLVFGQRDVCAPEREETGSASPACLRWLQLVVRSRGRLLAGWMPAAWVNPVAGITVADETAGATLNQSRFRIRPSHVTRGQAHFVVREAAPTREARLLEDAPHDLTVPSRDDGGFPRVTLERDGDAWVTRDPDGLVRTVELDAPVPRPR